MKDTAPNIFVGLSLRVEGDYRRLIVAIVCIRSGRMAKF